MNLDFSPEEKAFREEVRAYIAENYPAELRKAQQERRPLTKEELLLWHRVLARKGWAAPHWPVEYGGTGWTPTQRYIWSTELARADAQPLVPFGLVMLAPVLYNFGTEEQRRRFLPGILSGDVWWCQGYSEPGAGSDLANLKTRAERISEGGREYYLVNGQKIWTTLAHWADWGFFLVRTSSEGRPQAGISFLLIDMKTPGITVRPIITIDGGHEVNETFLKDVKVPVENLVHRENAGWTCAKALLAHERTGIAEVANSKRKLHRLRNIAQQVKGESGEPLISEPVFKRRLTELEIDLSALEFTELRTLAAESSGAGAGAESSILKIKGTEIQQRLQELTMDAIGYDGAAFLRDVKDSTGIVPDYAKGVAWDYFNGRKTSIFGGSNEIQRNIIAKTVLGL